MAIKAFFLRKIYDYIAYKYINYYYIKAYKFKVLKRINVKYTINCGIKFIAQSLCRNVYKRNYFEILTKAHDAGKSH